MQDRICKHIAMVINMCEDTNSSIYNGNRMIRREDYEILMIILDKFPERNLQSDASMNTNHAPFKRHPTLCDKREFSSFDAAMSAAEENRWWVEVYSSNGGPKCRTCGTQIKNNTLCITSDVIGTRPDPTRKTRKLYLAVNIFRFCLNNYCALNVPPHQKKMKKFVPMKELSCSFVQEKYFVDVVRLFVATNVNIKR